MTARPLSAILRRRAVLSTLLVLPVLAGCANVLEALQSLPRPSADVVGARITGLGLESADLEFDLRITNPLDTALPLVDLDVALGSRGTEFLQGVLPLQGTVPAGGERVVAVPVQVDLLQTLRTLAGVRPGQVVDYTAELGLGIDVPGVGPRRLPLRHEGRLPVPALPRVELGTLRLDELGLREVAGTAVLRVANPNAFAVMVDRLSLDLQLADRDVGTLTARQALELDADGAGTLELPMSLSPLDLGTAVLEALRSSSTGYGLAGGIGVDTPFGPFESALDVSGEVPIQRTR
jgi:LEA14-like dessication related protein